MSFEAYVSRLPTVDSACRQVLKVHGRWSSFVKVWNSPTHQHQCDYVLEVKNMKNLHSILLATDFCQASQAAAKVAVKLASVFGAGVTLLHAIEPVDGWPIPLHVHQAEESLREVVHELEDLKVTVTKSSVVVGPIADSILSQAREIKAGVILMGTGERIGPYHFSTGTIAQTVTEHAPQPVLVVRPGEPELLFRKILCPVDQSNTSQRGLRNAVQLARMFNSELVVMTVVPDVSWLSAAMETGQFEDARFEYEAKWRDEFEQSFAGVGLNDVRLKKEVRHGVPHEQIVDAAADHQADIIIMGATGRTGLVRFLLGSTTRHVLQQLPCSLLTVKHDDLLEEILE